MSYYLPVEVLEHIVSHLDPMQPTRSHRGPAWRGDAQARKALNALSVASRTCCRIAEPYLYSSIDIDGSLESFGSLELLLQTLMRRRELALHVRRIRVGDFVPDPADPGGKSRLIFVNLNGGETLTPIALWDEVPKIVLDRSSYNDLLRDKGHFPAIKFLDGTYTLGARHGVRQEMIYLLFVLCTALEDLELSIPSLGRSLNRLPSPKDGSSIFSKLKHLHLLRKSCTISEFRRVLSRLVSRGSLVDLRIDTAQNPVLWNILAEPLQLPSLRIDGARLNANNLANLATRFRDLQSLELYDQAFTADLGSDIGSIIARQFPGLQRLTLMPQRVGWATKNQISDLKSMDHLKHLHLDIFYLFQHDGGKIQPAKFCDVLPTSLQSLRIAQCKDYRIPHPRRFSAVKDVYATCDHSFSEHVGKLLSDSNYSTLDEIAIEFLSHLRAQYLDENGSIDPHRYITIPELHSKIVQAHWQKEATGRSRLRDFSSQHGWIPAIHEAGMITIRRKKNPS